MGHLDGVITVMSPDEIRALTAYQLAASDLADCWSPDAETSEGGDFLTGVRNAVLEQFEYGAKDGLDSLSWEDIRDSVSGIADDAPDYRTYQLWRSFVELGGMTEIDGYIDEYGADTLTRALASNSYDHLATLMLYVIAERLANQLFEALRLWADSQPEDDTEDTDAAGDGQDDDGTPVGGDDIRPEL